MPNSLSSGSSTPLPPDSPERASLHPQVLPQVSHPTPLFVSQTALESTLEATPAAACVASQLEVDNHCAQCSFDLCDKCLALLALILKRSRH
jgi:hypothetical protein